MSAVDAAAERAESVARESYGRLLALLAASNGDIAAAEDALGDAFVTALATWPERGTPDNPEGWLLTVARNRLRDLWKSAAWRTSAQLSGPLDAGRLSASAHNDSGNCSDSGSSGGTSGGTGDTFGAATMATDPYAQLERYLDGEVIPDKRLELLFVCAHPAVDARIHTPLMLQSVLGFEASQIAAAFAVPEATMAQRLVRAKRRIRDARIPFTVPRASDLPARLPPVLEAIYGAYAIDWLNSPGEGGQPATDEAASQGAAAEGAASTVAARSAEPNSLAGEALYLATVLAQLMPEQPEVLGLAALLSFSAARAPARLTAEGEPIGLHEQNTALWDAALITEGERLLRRARAAGSIGRFQLEAAIQSAHADRARSGTVDWAALATLHRALVRISPTLGARVALAATLGEAESPEAGLAALDLIDGAEHFQPAWATRAHLLARCGRTADARRAYDVAITLTAAPSIRTRLERAAALLR
ncbi:MAG: polymerase subunit sigma-70 [Subtercola sp.]|nr:polymerase subunit sigma-70 [Subtercola sp.]